MMGGEGRKKEEEYKDDGDGMYRMFSRDEVLVHNWLLWIHRHRYYLRWEMLVVLLISSCMCRREAGKKGRSWWRRKERNKGRTYKRRF